MLTNFNSMLLKAYNEHYAIGSFNAYNYETICGILKAGKAMGNIPLIVAFGKKYIGNMSLDDVSGLVRSLSGEYEMPICLHLDHCNDMDIIYKAIRAGFGSVMYDGSALPFEENLRNTKRVCEIAHACGVSVEAELGSLAAGEFSHEGTVDDKQIYTDPDSAATFVAETGVDALAVSIGTVHGLYKGKPNIRIDILKEINEKTAIPLVLHGGSGIPQGTIKECIQNGIAKINVNTEISAFTVERIKQTLKSETPHFSVLSKIAEQAVAEVVEKYMEFFSGV